MSQPILNAQQQLAATDFEHNLLLLAPAGTGKTNTLACRIANILSQKLAQPEEILCLTFTNKACREMKERIEKIAGEGGMRVIVRTLHGFCYDVIKAETKRHTDLFADFTIFDEVDCRSLLTEVCQQERPEESWPLRALQNLIEQLKSAKAMQVLKTGDASVSYEKVLARLIDKESAQIRGKCLDDGWRFYKQLYDGWCTWGASLTAAYDRRLQELHGLDFTDLIVRTGMLLQDDEITGRWARHFLYINVDEVQDTSELEYRVISRIFGASRLLLCGDYFQTIYEWRGSHPEIVLRAYEKAYQPRRIVLHENYRSTQVLLQASFACLQNMFPDRVAAIYPEGMEAMSQVPGAPIVIKGAQDIQDEAWWIYSTIQQLPVRDDYSRVCILTRTNRYNQMLSAQFAQFGLRVPKEERVPFMLIDEVKFYRRQEIKDALAFLKLTLNKHDVTSLVRILNRFGVGIGPATIRRIASENFRRAGIRITDYLDEQGREAGDPFGPLLDALDAENVVVFDVETTGVDPTKEEIIQIAGIRLDRKGQVKASFKRLLHPKLSVGDSVRVHHLTDELLAKEGEDPAKALQDFCAFAKGSWIVGHNVTFDLSILESELGRLDLPAFDYAGYSDTLDIFRRFYPNLPNHKLEFLGQHFHVKHASSHDAMDDILATAEILHYAVEQDIRPKMEERRARFAAYADKFHALAEKIGDLRSQADRLRPWQLLINIMMDGGIVPYYQERQEVQRIENLRDLIRKARELDDPSVSPRDAAALFLRATTLSTNDLDSQTDKPKIPLITVHQAKGSEFDYVFLAGVHDGAFPFFKAEEEGRAEEEKRLFYVAITRAKKQLFLSWSAQSGSHYQRQSPFISQIPSRYTQRV